MSTSFHLSDYLIGDNDSDTSFTQCFLMECGGLTWFYFIWSLALICSVGFSYIKLSANITKISGYHNYPQATRLTIDEKGWVHTGDLGYFDEDGQLYVVDRIKELIKYKGFQVCSANTMSIMKMIFSAMQYIA